MPDWATDEPEPVRSDAFWLREFQELETMRPFGVGFGLALGPIPVDKIRARGRELGLPRFGLELFVAVMRELDAFSAKWQAEEHKRRSDGDG